MTIPYNAKPFSNRSYIRDALKEKGIEIDKDDLTITVAAVRKAMNEEFPGPMAVMKWIEKEVSRMIRNNPNDEVYLEWKTPSGFVVVQHLQKRDTKTVSLHLLGTCQLEIAYDLNEPSITRHKAATAPNFIHSLDASLLHYSALQFNAPIALIHDSVLCRATDMAMLSCIVRENYSKIFSKDILKDFAIAIDAETEPPIIGDLEPSDVIDSTYFFC